MAKRALTIVATLTIIGSAACTESFDRSIVAINPVSGEERSFPDNGSVPDGWEICPDANCSGIPLECDPAECGPAPGMPAYLCEDGTTGGFTGRCIFTDSGSCSWEIRDCDPDDMCGPEDCGPPPLLDCPEIVCADGSIGGCYAECLGTAAGECSWEIGFRDCPLEACEELGLDECETRSDCALADDCDPMWGMTCLSVCRTRCRPSGAMAECPDGTFCDPANGVCMPLRSCESLPPEECEAREDCIVIENLALPVVPPERECHTACNEGGDECPEGYECDPFPCMGPMPCPGVCMLRSGGECTAAECGPAPELDCPEIRCEDGTIGGCYAECRRDDPTGACGWEIEYRDCQPLPECDETDCGPEPGLGCPVILCEDGSTAGCFAECVPVAGVCEWQIGFETCPGVSACRPEDCGPEPGLGCPVILCEDGSTAGCFAECVATAVGLCAWEIDFRDCPVSGSSRGSGTPG